jgi:hypothetical protein
LLLAASWAAAAEHDEQHIQRGDQPSIDQTQLLWSTKQLQHRHPASSVFSGRSSSSSSSRHLKQASGVLPTGLTSQQQSVAALAILPKFFISNVKASLATTYTWSVTRDASASGVAVTANGYDRKQIGE